MPVTEYEIIQACEKILLRDDEELKQACIKLKNSNNLLIKVKRMDQKNM